ncbi:MAG TPA: glutamine--fructose-6-phosphate transaminase (isomerizing) [Alphaproteobacteria bacterium]|nr:glutamine--fructose-6-phosphate transaminase (isomerizing) [Alphaproteobacteria bacterium]HOO51112.1 glutamine--fructose-6-phosphate transaminase (isomerizing) [Alphaproteobacteria bacterium]
MCGIIGIVSTKNIVPSIVEGLKRLEYRGYDSAGVATLQDNAIIRCRAEGKLVNLEERLKQAPMAGTIGIGHTRWATHGEPTENNAHPHATKRVAVVHNGIIENYAELKAELQGHQVRFETDTDTEVIAHLVDHYMTQGEKPEDAAHKAFDRLRGAYSVVLMFTGENNLLIGARQGTPLAIGYGEEEMYIASDSYALSPFTRKICFLEDGDRLVVTNDNIRLMNGKRKPVDRPVRITAQSGATTGKGEYRHYMLKEIYEQPAVIADTLNSFVNPTTGRITLPNEVLEALLRAPRITLIACGTAYYACLVAKYWFETVARVSCEVDVASEFRYREAPLPNDGLAIFVSQSGETLDTLEALRYCKNERQMCMAIVNTIESTIEREAHLCLHTLAGPEIGVASTKAFTTQLTTLACLALSLASAKGVITQAQEADHAYELRAMPKIAATILSHDAEIQNIAKDIAQARDVLYLGRGALYPMALEGALKLKEISYIHAEGYASGEMKHGPIALIDENVPVVVLAPSDRLFEKTASNVQETIARGGKVLLVTDEKGAKTLGPDCQWVVTIAEMHPFITPILYALPIQLLAYHAAVAKGTDVDQPRNLAKSVTVE